MLDFKEFENEIIRKLNCALEDEFSDTGLEVRTLNKCGRKMICMYDCGENELQERVNKFGTYALVGYVLDDLYESYLHYPEIDELAEEVLHTLLSQYDSIDASVLTDYSYVKENMIIRCANRSSSIYFLRNLIHTDVEDISFYIQIRISDRYKDQFIYFTKELFEKYRISKKRIFNDALYRSMILLPGTISNLRDHCKDADLQNDVFLVTSEQLKNGAAAIVYPNVLELLEVKCHGNFFIIPASTQGVYVYPELGLASIEELGSLLKKINRGNDSEKYLSRNVLYYDTARKRFISLKKYMSQYDSGGSQYVS